MDFIYELLNLSATACYAAIAALFVYHLLTCWQRTLPSPVPAIAVATPTIDLPATLPAPTIAAASIAPSPEPEPTPIADVATTPTIKHRRQAKGFGNKSTQPKQQKKRQPVTA